MQPWTTVMGSSDVAGAEIVAHEDTWVDTRGMEQLYIKAEMLEWCASTLNLIIEKAMSREGPWTTLLTVNSAYTAQSILLSAEVGTGATYQLENYVRWHISSEDNSPWATCFRINTRQWP